LPMRQRSQVQEMLRCGQPASVKQDWSGNQSPSRCPSLAAMSAGEMKTIDLPFFRISNKPPGNMAW